VGYFSATPPIAGSIQGADLIRRDGGTDRSWTSNIFVLPDASLKPVEPVVAGLRSPPHESRKASDHDDLANLRAWVNQKHPDQPQWQAGQKLGTFMEHDVQND